MGIATSEAGTPLDATNLISRADAALYSAKRSGRDRYAIHGKNDEAWS